MFETRGSHDGSLSWLKTPAGFLNKLQDFSDLGIFIGTVMVAARGFGLDTCPQAAFADYHAIIPRELGIPQNEIVICGMAVGHADPGAPENRLVTERAPPAEFATFEGFPSP